VRCKNQKFLKEDDVCKHLLIKGFLPCYEKYIIHGEPYVIKPMLVGPLSVGISHVVNDVCPVVAEELPNLKATNFYKLLKVAREPLWDRCTKQSKLYVCVQLLNMKSTLNLT